jgi:hypothetical protein
VDKALKEDRRAGIKFGFLFLTFILKSKPAAVVPVEEKLFPHHRQYLTLSQAPSALKAISFKIKQ